MNILYIGERKRSGLKNFFSCLSLMPEMKMIFRNFHGSNGKDYARCYRILGLDNDADQESVRRAFILLCKKYHPDSGNPEADSVKFQEIENAYRLLQNKFADERWNVNEGLGEYGLYYNEEKKTDLEVKVFDIKHQAPQHRQYLSFYGVGSGTPSQRQKQYIAHQRLAAIQNVHDHRIKKLSEESAKTDQALIMQDKKEAKKIKTRYGLERLVEDLIQESMAKGEFDNLKGAGKPLPQGIYNPHVDFVTHKMNQIMIDNGFIPEWIILQKEIAEEIDIIKDALIKERRTYGPLPLNSVENAEWRHLLKSLSENAQRLNSKIDKFNLVVPILDKQMLHFNLRKVSERILETGDCSKVHKEANLRKSEKQREPEEGFDVISFFFGNR